MRAGAVWSALVLTLLAAAPMGYGRGNAKVDPQRSSDEYAWRLFVTLNVPAGQAASGIDGPTAWESWATRSDLLRDDGADPGRWEALRPGGTPPGRFERLSAKDLPNVRHIVAGRMAAGADPVATASRLTEIRFDRTAFDYVRQHRLYCAAGQLELLRAGTAVSFPASAKTIKARWRPIREADRSRYHTLDLPRADGTHQLYGLVALHIATKDLPDWFWATFEHEDNPSRAGGEPWQVPSRDTFACRGVRPDCGRAPSGLGLERTVWSHYRLRGTMTGFVDAGGQPRRLANSDLESGFQATSSCMTCHARAAVAVGGGVPRHLPVFASADPTRRRGFLGAPQAAWYEVAEGHATKTTHFQPLDFIWSLALAAKATPPAAPRP